MDDINSKTTLNNSSCKAIKQHLTNVKLQKHCLQHTINSTVQIHCEKFSKNKLKPKPVFIPTILSFLLTKGNFFNLNLISAPLNLIKMENFSENDKTTNTQAIGKPTSTHFTRDSNRSKPALNLSPSNPLINNKRALKDNIPEIQFLAIFIKMPVRLKNKEYREMFNALGVEHIDLAFVEYNSDESELFIVHQ